METIQFDETTFIWRTKLNLAKYKETFLKESKMIIDSMPYNITDGYGIRTSWPDDMDSMGVVNKKIELDNIIQMGINLCKQIYDKTNNKYNRVNYDSWVNVVKHANQAQLEYKNLDYIDKFHTHTTISEKAGGFYPNYTFVYYIQMPDVMNGEDGVLYFKDKSEKEYWVRPEEDELIIMPGDIPHFPNSAPNSTIDRIVVAGNVGFENIKKLTSLI